MPGGTCPTGTCPGVTCLLTGYVQDEGGSVSKVTEGYVDVEV